MGSLKAGSKYEALFRYLRRQSQVEIPLTFDQVESLIAEPLPESARSGAAFWSNRRGGLQASAWLEAGYRVDRVDPERGAVVFRRLGVPPGTARAKPGWDADLVRALREHLGLNQSELASLLGVRQQTVSEWERGVYLPARGRSRHLDLVAERAKFAYGPDRV